MELWIRSQDGNSLIKTNHLYGDIFPEDGYFKIFDMPGENILGKYKSKERTIEILNEIQNILQPQINYREPEMYTDIQKAAYRMSQEIEFNLKNSGQIVFIMPGE